MPKVFHKSSSTTDSVSVVGGVCCSPQASFDVLSNSPGMDNSGRTCLVIDALRVDNTNGQASPSSKLIPTGLGNFFDINGTGYRKPCASAHGTAATHSQHVHNSDFLSNFVAGDSPRRNHPNFGCLEHGQLGAFTSLIRPPSVRVALSVDYTS
jgi:hypothetical protein